MWINSVAMKSCRNELKITPEMTVLDIVSRYRETEAVFKRYDEVAGECICCNALFDTLSDTADRYRIDLQEMTEALKNAAVEE